jgi:DNA processing protein
VVTIKDLLVSEDFLLETIKPLVGDQNLDDPIEFFAALAWSVICEPGDSFAGKLIDAFGASQALALELAGVDALEYFARFDDLSFDPGRTIGQFQKSMFDARERWQPRMSSAAVAKASSEMEQLGGWFMTSGSEHWPSGFESLDSHSPRGLWVRGATAAISQASRAVSIVGSRMSSSYGDFATGEIVGELVNKGYSVVSGGAYGIDASAHRATLALKGTTLAVMAGGLDHLYPSGNAELFRQIEAGGALISEMPPGAEPTKWRFLQRNRLIAALGQATVVIEANPRSGAVSTANRALELGRPLGAVPGPINSSGSDGCHQLIRELKAELITSGADVLELMGVNAEDEQLLVGLGALETRVLDVIGFGEAGFAQICLEAGLTRDEARMGLSGLSLRGVVEQKADGWSRS